MPERKIADLPLLGGRLCLDFVNTADYAAGAITQDHLTSYHDLTVWGGRAGLLEAETAEELRIEAASMDKPAARTLALARNLRAGLRDIFHPGSTDTDVGIGIEVLNAVAQRVLPSVRLHYGSGRVRHAGGTLESWLIGPLTISACELAASPARKAVRLCAHNASGWLCID